MLKFCICDNDFAFCEKLEICLKQYGISRCIEIQTEVYYSGKNLLRDLQNTYYDLLLLDIVMGDIGGVEIGRKLREEFHNNTTQIIFISSLQGYEMELFRLHPIDFLLKPFKRNDLYRNLDLVVELAGINAIIFTYKIGRTHKKCKYQDILYFERTGRKTEIVCYDYRDAFYSSLREIADRVFRGRFFYCHESLLVNFDNVKEFLPNKLVMVNNDVLEISQGKRSEVKELREKWLV